MDEGHGRPQKTNGHADKPARPRTRAEERIAALETPSASELIADVERLKDELGRAQQEAGDNRTGWQRTAADFSNYKRRTEQEREQSLGLANEYLLLKLLAVADDFDRALAGMPRELEHLSWIEGLWLVERKLRSLLESEGVTPIDAVGRPFDPREHEAVVTEESTTAEEDSVLSELQKGYRIRDRVLRPALVTVATRPSEAPSGGATPAPEAGSDGDENVGEGTSTDPYEMTYDTTDEHTDTTEA